MAPESNEELLGQGECPRQYCIEPAGHTGPCSGDMVRGLPALQRKLHEAQEERDAAVNSSRLLMIVAQGARQREDAAVERGVRAIHYLCGTSEALREIVATLLVEAEAAEALLEDVRKQKGLDHDFCGVCEWCSDILPRIALVLTPAEAQAQREDSGD